MSTGDLAPVGLLDTNDAELTLDVIFRRAEQIHSASEVVSWKGLDREPQRGSFGQVAERARRLAAALQSMGIRPYDRVATFAWNHQEHLEAYYAIPCIGAVLHTVNIRLSADQLVYTLNHAESRVMIVDGSLASQVAAIRPQLRFLETLVVVGEVPSDVSCGDWIAYEDLIDSAEPLERWPQIAERTAAALCYTSGTTGDPKGVTYSHRTLVLHALTVLGMDVFRVAGADRVLPAVPMFHALAWNLPYAAGLCGAALIFPGPYLQAAELATAIERERVTYSAGVPTIWMDLLRHVGRDDGDLSSLRTLVCGGSAVPRSLMQRYDAEHGIDVVQGWGMTETLPGAAMAHDVDTDDVEARWDARALQGRVSPLYDVRVVDDGGLPLTWDGESVGEFEIRGPLVAKRYYLDTEGSVARFHDGWLRTGDAGTIAAGGWLRLTDRSKDVIKSGGEWISSVDLESALMDHEQVAEAAVIAVPDERWSERPLALVVSATGKPIPGLREYLLTRFPRWWVPELISYGDTIPKTSVGKFDKKRIRADHAAGALTVVDLA